MLFLSKGPLHHEALWRRWFALARNKLPYDGLAAAVCGTQATTDMLLQVGWPPVALLAVCMCFFAACCVVDVRQHGLPNP